MILKSLLSRVEKMLASSAFHRFFARGITAFTNDGEFKAKVADTFFDLADYFSSKYENLGDNLIIDAQEDSLSLKTPRHTILCSRQTPHRQIWLSSPVHGSLKFDFDNELDKWFEEKETSLEITKSLTKEIDMTIKSE